MYADRQPLLDHLLVDEIILEAEQDTQDMKRIGKEITDTLDYVAGSLRIKRIHNVPKQKRADPTTLDLPRSNL